MKSVITIETNKLTKAFGARNVVDKLDLQVAKGTVFGFVGTNGAGKTTTIKLLVGILKPTSGTIRLLGEELKNPGHTIKQRMGVVTEDLSLFEHLKGQEQLYFTSRIYGLDTKTIQERSEELFELFGLQNHQHRFVRDYSKGMKKKLALMSAIIHNPEILILDEPFEGIDPVSMRVIQKNLSQMAQNGVTIFLTSHNLLLIETMCTEVAIIHKGEKLFHGSVPDVRNKVRNEMQATGESGLEALFLELVSPDQEPHVLSWLADSDHDKKKTP
jgi:ABC-2 type transport system ATP-binding protein